MSHNRPEMVLSRDLVWSACGFAPAHTWGFDLRTEDGYGAHAEGWDNHTWPGQCRCGGEHSPHVQFDGLQSPSTSWVNIRDTRGGNTATPLRAHDLHKIGPVR